MIDTSQHSSKNALPFQALAQTPNIDQLTILADEANVLWFAID
jgi:hypothetical protein